MAHRLQLGLAVEFAIPPPFDGGCSHAVRVNCSVVVAAGATLMTVALEPCGRTASFAAILRAVVHGGGEPRARIEKGLTAPRFRLTAYRWGSP